MYKPRIGAAMTAVAMVAAAAISAQAGTGVDAVRNGPVLLVQQGQGGGQGQGNGQGEAGNRSQSENQSQNENQNQNENRNQSRDRNQQAGGNPARMMTRQEATAIADYACFFEEANMAGEAFCIGGRANLDPLPPRWNDRISSVEIGGRLAVKVCTEPGLAGECEVLTKSYGKLPSSLNDKISSLMVE